MSSAPRHEAIETAVAEAYRHEWAYVLAATIQVTGDIDTAEECAQEAFSRALTTWPKTGIPTKTGAWLTTVARRRAIDVVRRRTRHNQVLAMISRPEVTEEPVNEELGDIPDDRLRLIFTCCHPSLSIEAQVALTLRLVCGLTTSEVAHAFLVPEPTMAARITRAKKKITASHIPYRVPTAAELPARVDTVLSVVHLVFTTGHTAPSGAELMRRDLVERSLELTRMLRFLLPSDPNVAGLLALILLTDARNVTRTNAAGEFLPLADQNRSLWNQSFIIEGSALVSDALHERPHGRYELMAAIAAEHANAARWEETNWRAIVSLYDQLWTTWPSPVVALNRAVALGFANGAAEGLRALDELGNNRYLAGYNYLASARAEFLSRLGRNTEARAAYEEAMRRCENDVERAFLGRKLSAIAAN